MLGYYDHREGLQMYLGTATSGSGATELQP